MFFGPIPYLTGKDKKKIKNMTVKELKERKRFLKEQVCGISEYDCIGNIEPMVCIDCHTALEIIEITDEILRRKDKNVK